MFSWEAVVPAGTAKDAGWTFDLTMPVGTVVAVSVRVPPGPRGEVGFALGAAGVAVLPENPGGWIVTDDETIPWDTEDQISSGAWELLAYNTGQYDHSIYVRIWANPVAAGVSGTVLQPVQVDGGGNAPAPVPGSDLNLPPP